MNYHFKVVNFLFYSFFNQMDNSVGQIILVLYFLEEHSVISGGLFDVCENRQGTLALIFNWTILWKPTNCLTFDVNNMYKLNLRIKKNHSEAF